MKKHIFLLSLLVFISCNEDPVPVPEPETFLPYEEVNVSFSLPGLNMDYENCFSFCDESRYIHQGLEYGGSSGYRYMSGYSLDDFTDGGISEVLVRLIVRGVEEINSTTIELEKILALQEEFPERCFVEFFIEIDGTIFKNVWYNNIPFEVLVADENAQSHYTFSEDYWEMECFGNWPVLPVEFEYDGYLYTHERQDSIRVSNLKSSFLVMKNF